MKTGEAMVTVKVWKPKTRFKQDFRLNLLLVVLLGNNLSRDGDDSPKDLQIFIQKWIGGNGAELVAKFQVALLVLGLQFFCSDSRQAPSPLTLFL